MTQLPGTNFVSLEKFPSNCFNSISENSLPRSKTEFYVNYANFTMLNSVAR